MYPPIRTSWASGFTRCPAPLCRVLLASLVGQLGHEGPRPPLTKVLELIVEATESAKERRRLIKNLLYLQNQISDRGAVRPLCERGWGLGDLCRDAATAPLAIRTKGPSAPLKKKKRWMTRVLLKKALGRRRSGAPRGGFSQPLGLHPHLPARAGASSLSTFRR